MVLNDKAAPISQFYLSAMRVSQKRWDEIFPPRMEEYIVVSQRVGVIIDGRCGRPEMLEYAMEAEVRRRRVRNRLLGEETA